MDSPVSNATVSTHESPDKGMTFQMAYVGNHPLDSLSASDSQALSQDVEQRHPPQPQGGHRIHKHRITTQHGMLCIRRREPVPGARGRRISGFKGQ